jgi:nucleotide-binding universal stress UspA family protein
MLGYLDQSKANSQRLDTAVEAAQGLEAHLTGLTIAQTPHIPEFMPADFISQQQKMAEDRNAGIRKAFEKRLRGTDLLWDWRSVTMTSPAETPLDVLALHSHYADLTVVGQPRPDDADGIMPMDLPGKLAMVSGRPVLALPYAWRPAPIARKVLIAWNASREATRAVHDAMPFLARAEEVRVLALTRSGGLAGHGEQPGADMAAHLARHGINAVAEHSVVEDIEVPDALLSAAADYGSELLVMGAYGRSRISEIVMGGTSRGILRSMTLPVLLSH